MSDFSRKWPENSWISWKSLSLLAAHTSKTLCIAMLHQKIEACRLVMSNPQKGKFFESIRMLPGFFSQQSIILPENVIFSGCPIQTRKTLRFFASGRFCWSLISLNEGIFGAGTAEPVLVCMYLAMRSTNSLAAGVR